VIEQGCVYKGGKGSSFGIYGLIGRKHLRYYQKKAWLSGEKVVIEPLDMDNYDTWWNEVVSCPQELFGTLLWILAQPQNNHKVL
jgi:hypothetical protein